jgi:hypothetical protein
VLPRTRSITAQTARSLSWSRALVASSRTNRAGLRRSAREDEPLALAAGQPGDPPTAGRCAPVDGLSDGVSTLPFHVGHSLEIVLWLTP